MATATKFTFGTDFGEGGRRSGEMEQAAARAELAAQKAAAREEARVEALAEGFRSGQDQARQEIEAQLGALAGQLAQSAERLFAEQAARSAMIEEQAGHLAITLARALAGAALAEKPQAALAGAIRECLGHARQAPHLVLRVNEAAVEMAEELARRLAAEQGFAGRLIVLGEPEIAPGDGRIEWAEGGFVLDSQQIAALVEHAVLRVFGRSLTES